MATRAEVIQHIRSYSDVEDMGDGGFKVVYSFDDGRSQLLFMKVLDDLLLMSSPFAHQDDITSTKAIDLAVIYGVGMVGEYYVLKNVLHIEDIDESEIVNGAGLLAVRADTLEEQVGGDRF